MNKNGKCFTGPTKNLLYNDTNGNINGFVNINVFYKQNDANEGVGDIAHAPGISKQSCLLLFQIYSGLLAAVAMSGPALAVGNGDDSD